MFAQLSFLIKVSIKLDWGFMLVDSLHRIRVILYIPTKRIFYHFDSKSAYFTAKNGVDSRFRRKNGRVDWIWTSDLSVPNRALYQAEPQPVMLCLVRQDKPSNICRSMLPLQLAGSGEASPTFCLSCGGNCVGSFLGLAKCKRAATRARNLSTKNARLCLQPLLYFGYLWL